MVSNKKPTYRKKGKLNLFGQVIEEIRIRQGVTWDTWAEEGGFDASTISRNATEGGNRPQPETLEKLLNAMRMHKPWLNDWGTAIINAADRSTVEQKAAVEQLVIYMREHPEFPGSDGEKPHNKGRGH